jgi:hypothetical protein
VKGGRYGATLYHRKRHFVGSIVQEFVNDKGVLIFINRRQEIDQHRGVVKEAQFGLI